MHVFTSITANYLPKAAALAFSVKRAHPDAVFHVVLCDSMPDCSTATTGAFDSVINVQQLPIENLSRWIFKHRLVELCTAVKGTAFQYIAREFGAERIYYFDPDIVVLSPFDGLECKLDESSILLTPHLAEPETDPQAILDNEICACATEFTTWVFLRCGPAPKDAASSTGGRTAAGAFATTTCPAGCSRTSAGSTWHRRSSKTSRSCASPNLTWRPGT